jgi:hypothetical protein
MDGPSLFFDVSLARGIFQLRNRVCGLNRLVAKPPQGAFGEPFHYARFSILGAVDSQVLSANGELRPS